MLTSPRRYDVVISEPSNPYRARVASLFTHEFWGPTDYRPEVLGAVDWPRVEELRERAALRVARENAPGGSKSRAVNENCDSKISRAKASWPAGAEPTDLVEVWTKAYIVASEGGETTSYTERLHSEGFVAEALLVKERLAEARQQPAEAVQLMLSALSELRATALPLCDANGRASRRSVILAREHPEHAPALLHALAQAPFAVYADERSRRTAMTSLAAAATLTPLRTDAPAE